MWACPCLLETVLEKVLTVVTCALGRKILPLEMVLACFFQVPGGAHSTWNYSRQNQALMFAGSGRLSQSVSPGRADLPLVPLALSRAFGLKGPGRCQTLSLTSSGVH